VNGDKNKNVKKYTACVNHALARFLKGKALR
jgi:hypothetical protein